MEIHKLSPSDYDFAIRKSYNLRMNELTRLCEFDSILYDELHMGPEYEEVTNVMLHKMLDDNPMYAKAYIDLAVGYEDLAKKGILLAKSRLAWMYRFTYDVNLQDKGRKYAKEAAEAGLLQAQFVYARLVPDDSEARYWMQKAADAGYPFAICELGCWYKDGVAGLEKDKSRALQLWEKASTTKSAEMQAVALWGDHRLSNDGFRDFLQGIAGNDYAYHMIPFDIGFVYYGQKNYRKAYEWLKKAVDLGDINACEYINTMYSEKGFVGNETKAYWQRMKLELEEAKEYFLEDLAPGYKYYSPTFNPDGIFARYSDSTPALDGNYNLFVPQNIRLRVNGREPLHKCLYKIVEDVACLDPGTARPEMHFWNDLGLDDVDLSEILRAIDGHVLFESRRNAFTHWYEEMMGRLSQGNAYEHIEWLADMTLNDLENRINSGCPVSVAKYE